jgi:hypothetical protein
LFQIDALTGVAATVSLYRISASLFRMDYRQQEVQSCRQFTHICKKSIASLRSVYSPAHILVLSIMRAVKMKAPCRLFWVDNLNAIAAGIETGIHLNHRRRRSLFSL